MSDKVTLIRPRLKQGVTLRGQNLDNPGGEVTDLLTFDLTREESHQRGSQVTDHPVEGGGLVNDHVQAEPFRLSLEVLISATPLGGVASEPGRVVDAHQYLTGLHASGLPMRVVTSLADYGSMVMTGYQTRVNRDTGETLVASLEFKEIRFVRAERVDIPGEIIEVTHRAGAQSRVAAGKQTTTKPTEEEAKRGGSILHGIFGAK